MSFAQEMKDFVAAMQGTSKVVTGISDSLQRSRAQDTAAAHEAELERHNPVAEAQAASVHAETARAHRAMESIHAINAETQKTHYKWLRDNKEKGVGAYGIGQFMDAASAPPGVSTFDRPAVPTPYNPMAGIMPGSAIPAVPGGGGPLSGYRVPKPTQDEQDKEPTMRSGGRVPSRRQATRGAVPLPRSAAKGAKPAPARQPLGGGGEGRPTAPPAPDDTGSLVLPPHAAALPGVVRDLPVSSGGEGYDETPVATDESTQAFQEGGTVEDDEDTEGTESGAEEPTEPTEPAIPTMGAAPATRSLAQPAGSPTAADMPSVRAANHAALTTLNEEYGLSGAGAIHTPDQSGKIRRMWSGVDAAHPEDVMKARKLVDPEDQLSDSQKNLRAYALGYDHFLKQNDIAGAKKFAAGFVMYAQKEAANYADEVLKALKKGDMQSATELAQKAYGSVPDGRDIEISDENGKAVYALKDANGQVMERGVFTPQQLAGAALGMKNGSAFYEALSRAAGIRPEKQEAPPSPAFQRGVQALQGQQEAKGAIPEPGERSPADTGEYGQVPIGASRYEADVPEGAIPTPGGVSAADLASMTPRERAAVIAGQKQLAGPRAAAGRQGAGEAGLKPGERKTHEETVKAILDPLFNPAEGDKPEIKQAKTEMAKYRSDIDIATSQLMGTNRNASPHEAAQAALSMLHVDAANPDQQRFNIQRDERTGEIAGIRYGSGRFLRANADQLLPLLTLRRQMVSDLKKKQEQEGRPSADYWGPMGRGVQSLRMAGTPAGGEIPAMQAQQEGTTAGPGLSQAWKEFLEWRKRNAAQTNEEANGGQ